MLEGKGLRRGGRDGAATYNCEQTPESLYSTNVHVIRYFTVIYHSAATCKYNESPYYQCIIHVIRYFTAIYRGNYVLFGLKLPMMTKP